MIKDDFIYKTKNSDYWNNRAKMMFENLEKDEEKIKKKLKLIYKAESERLNKDIAYYYTKYGYNNIIEYRNLLKKLSEDEKVMLYEKVDSFFKRHPEYSHLEEVRKNIYKLDRIEGINLSIQLQNMRIADKENDVIEKHLIDVYNKATLDSLKELGQSGSLNSVNQSVAKKLVNNKWVDGLSFSDRIYNNRDKVAKWVSSEFKNGVIRGDSYKVLSDRLCSRFSEVSLNNAMRLVRTEGTYVTNEASISVFEKDFEQYKYNAIIDNRTSVVCKSLNGETFNIKERQPGVNFPPMHPYCRSSFDVVVPDNFLDKKINGINDKSLIDNNYIGYNEDKDISGVKLGKPMTFKEANSGNVNPNYGKDKGYSINCQTCVPVFEARLRGYDVIAKANTKGSTLEKLSRQTNLIWIDPSTNEKPNYIYDEKVNTPKKALQFLKDTIKKGERYSLQFGWKGRSNSGHIVNIDINENNLLRIKDNQRGKDEVSEWIGDKEVLGYLKRIKYTRSIYGNKFPTPPKLLRLDNMKFNFDVANEIMEGVIHGEIK